MSLFDGFDMVKAPMKGVQPTTPAGKKARYIGMIETQIYYLNEMKEGRTPKVMGKKGEANARTWFNNQINGIFCKIRWGKGFLKLSKNGADAIRVSDFDTAIAFYEKIKGAVEDGSFEKEMKVSF